MVKAIYYNKYPEIFLRSFDENNYEPMTIDHWLMIGHYVSDRIPIIGKGRVILYFYLCEQTFPKYFENVYNYYPGYYLPYSNVVADRMNKLVTEGYLRMMKVNKVTVFFMISNKGYSIIRPYLSSLNPDILVKMSELKEELMERNIKECQRLVSLRYPESSKFKYYEQDKKTYKRNASGIFTLNQYDPNLQVNDGGSFEIDLE